jgi:uncharacterized membrane protein
LTEVLVNLDGERGPRGLPCSTGAAGRPFYAIRLWKKASNGFTVEADRRFAPRQRRTSGFPWAQELVMADIHETASNLLEKISKYLEKPKDAMVLGGGIALAIIILYHTRNLFSGGYLFGPFFTFLHVVSGITWIGLLYYFNLVQIPTMPKIPPEQKQGVVKYIAPEALFWFRWAMVATVVTGAIVFFSGTAAVNFTLITGIILGLIMAFNVWFIIWPNQQKVLGLVPADDDEKSKSARLAMLTSRANFVLSVPMLYCMVTARLVG